MATNAPAAAAACHISTRHHNIGVGGGSYNHTAPLRAQLSRHGHTLRASRARATRDVRSCPTAIRAARHHTNNPRLRHLHVQLVPSASPAPARATSCSLDATRPRPWRAPSSTHAYTTHTLRSSSSLVLTFLRARHFSPNPIATSNFLLSLPVCLLCLLLPPSLRCSCCAPAPTRSACPLPSCVSRNRAAHYSPLQV